MTWDLSVFFKNQDELDEYVSNLDKISSNFNAKFANNISNLNENDFLTSLKEYENIHLMIDNIASYAYLTFAKDTSKGAFLAKYDEICTKFGERILFYELEFNEISPEKQEKFIEFCKDYGYFLSLIIKDKPHQLSYKEERVLLKTKNTGAEAFSRLFDETMTRLEFDFEGQKLSQEQILSKLHDSDRETRKKAALSLSQTLNQNSHLLTYIINMIKTDLKNNCELRGYEFAESPRHLSNQISKKSVDALINASENSFDLVSKFYDKKREILGFEKLYDYDRYAPLNDDESYKFDKAKEIVLQAFSDFSPKFGNLAKTAFDENWCDVYPSKNKQGGAFSHSTTAKAHPFVLLNYTDKRRDLFTLAHELGHAIHQFLSYKAGHLNSRTPLTTAETASVFCEMLVFDYVKNSVTKEQKISLLASKIEDIFATLYRQINFTTFERELHSKNEELSTDEISQIWLTQSKKMFGESLILNDYYKIWWSYIPHFIHSPFYCYSYSYAQLLVLTLFGLYKSRKIPNFAEIYTEFLSLGGSKSPKEMVAKFGLDIESDGFWQIGINEVRNLVDEFCKL